MTTGSRIEVSSALAAWTMANTIFPGDFQKDTMSSERAGYPVYRSTVEYYNYICDLSNRLEINLKDGKDNKTAICPDCGTKEAVAAYVQSMMANRGK